MLPSALYLECDAGVNFHFRCMQLAPFSAGDYLALWLPQAILLHHVEIRCVEQARCETQSPLPSHKQLKRIDTCCFAVVALIFFSSHTIEEGVSVSCAGPLPWHDKPVQFLRNSVCQ